MLTDEQVVKIKELYGCLEIHVYKEAWIAGRSTTKIKMDGVSRNRQTSAWLVEIKYNRKLTKNETVDHIDENKQNDSMDNLQILTRAENAKKSYDHHIWNNTGIARATPRKITESDRDKHRGANNGMAKLTADQVTTIRMMYNSGSISIVELCIMYSLSIKAVFNIVTVRSYRNVGDVPVIITTRENRYRKSLGVKRTWDSDIINIIKQIKSGIFLTDISKQTGIDRCTLRDRITSYCVRNGIEYPKKSTSSVDNP